VPTICFLSSAPGVAGAIFPPLQSLTPAYAVRADRRPARLVARLSLSAGCSRSEIMNRE
jgi:hypothetical protein